MIRHALAVAVALCVSPAWLYAQGAQLTVNTASATVYKGPSVGSPVIGQASRGTVLEVTRELGDWVKVAWPSMPDGSGYIRLTAGTLSRGPIIQPAQAPTARYQEPALTSNGSMNGAAPEATSQPVPMSSPISRVMSFGGRMGGSALGFGASLRGWSKNHLGLQMEISRYSLTSPVAAGQVTTVEIAPSILYSLPNRVGDYVWLRPYVGGGLNFQRSTQSGFGSASKTGFQAFGGGEFTFASAPRLAVSTDVGYRNGNAPYEGFELGDLRVSLSAHWYLK